MKKKTVADSAEGETALFSTDCPINKMTKKMWKREKYGSKKGSKKEDLE